MAVRKNLGALGQGYFVPVSTYLKIGARKEMDVYLLS